MSDESISITGHTLHTDTGKLHYRKLEAAGRQAEPALICLHPAPHDGAYFSEVMPHLNAGRTVLAIDYPGYGKSDAPAAAPGIDVYAEAVIQLINALAKSGISSVDLLGFHTGCLVAAETALRNPELVRRIVLIDVPFFDAAEQAGKYAEAITKLPPEPELWGFHAAFTYRCEERFSQLSCDTRIIATGSSLLEPTRRAAHSLPEARLVERTDITKPVFAAHAPSIAAEILANLADHA